MDNRVIHYEWRNKPEEIVIGGRKFKFKSQAERKWAQYLEALLSMGAIKSWKYEPQTFEFGERWRVRKQYTPDFFVKEIDDTAPGEIAEHYQEVKTSLRQTDVTRFRCLAADFPEVRIVLVIFGSEHTSKANQNRLRSNARKYVERIVFARPLCKKMGIK